MPKSPYSPGKVPLTAPKTGCFMQLGGRVSLRVRPKLCSAWLPNSPASGNGKPASQFAREPVCPRTNARLYRFAAAVPLVTHHAAGLLRAPPERLVCVAAILPHAWGRGMAPAGRCAQETGSGALQGARLGRACRRAMLTQHAGGKDAACVPEGRGYARGPFRLPPAVQAARLRFGGFSSELPRPAPHLRDGRRHRT